MARARLISMSAGRHLLPLSAVAELVASLARAVVLARILPPDQFGVAIALALVLSLAEMAADLGLDRQVVRLDLTGDIAAQRGTLHGLALAKGALLAALLAALAWPLSMLFGAPDAWPAFAALAICPLLKGSANLGVKEIARDYRFGPDALAVIAQHVVTLLLAVVLALVIAKAWVVSAALIAGYVAYGVLSHALAPHRWRLAWHSPTAGAAWRFGAPLLPNGMAQGLKNVGDRLIVGALLGPAALALYSVTAMIGVMPRGIILRYLTTTTLPRFVNTGGGAAGASLMAAFAVLMGTIAMALGLGLWVFGKPVVALVFGAAYEPTQALMSAVAIMVVLKLLFATVTLPAMAFGATALMLYGAVGSALGIALAAVGLWWRPDLLLFVHIVAACDAIALLAAVVLGGARIGLRAPAVLAATFTPVIALYALILWPGEAAGLLGVRVMLGAGAALLLAALALLLLRRAGVSPSRLVVTLLAKPASGLKDAPDDGTRL